MILAASSLSIVWTYMAQSVSRRHSCCLYRHGKAALLMTTILVVVCGRARLFCHWVVRLSFWGSTGLSPEIRQKACDGTATDYNQGREKGTMRWTKNFQCPAPLYSVENSTTATHILSWISLRAVVNSSFQATSSWLVVWYHQSNDTRVQIHASAEASSKIPSGVGALPHPAMDPSLPR